MDTVATTGITMEDFAFLSLLISICLFICNILLWVTTYFTLKEIRRQNNNIKISIKADAFKNITEAHRNIFINILNKPELSKIMSGNNDVEGFSKQMIASLLINHCSNVHLFFQKNLIDKDDFIGMQNDILDLFNWPIVKERWPEIRAFYSLQFQELIDNLLIRGRIIQHNDFDDEVLR